MEIQFNVTKDERKSLVSAVSELTGWEAVYKGTPSFAYVVNNYIVDKNGTIIYDERTGIDEVRRLLAGLAERGFVFEGGIDGITPSAGTDDSASDDTPVDEAPYRMAIEIPLDVFTQTALDNLERLVEGKAALLMKAVGADALPVERTETTLRFPWFQLSSSENETDAYSRFIFALCDMAKRQKRVTLKETDTDSESSEKFAFRCFCSGSVLSATNQKRRGKFFCQNSPATQVLRLAAISVQKRKKPSQPPKSVWQTGKL